MIGLCRVVENDLFDVAFRIKQIDDSYFTVYNYVERRYEVHSTSQRGNSLAVVIPFGELDARAVDYVRKTRSERISQLIEETERANQKIERDKIRRAVKLAEKEVERAYALEEKYEQGY